jgi:hypothetical protein
VTSDRLALDYLRRARLRREALDLLFRREGYADVVRGSQEVVELILKGTLRFIGVDPPKRHDVRLMVVQFVERLPATWAPALEDLAGAATELTHARAEAFYGDEETLTPASELFDRDDATRALMVVDRLLDLYGPLLDRPDPATDR